MVWRLIRFLFPIVLAFAVIAPIACFAYAVSLDTSTVQLSVKAVGIPIGAETNTITVALVSAASGALITLLVLVPLFAVTRGSRVRRQERELKLYRSKLLERDEEIERLRKRLREGEPQEAWAVSDSMPAEEEPAPEPAVFAADEG